MSQKSRKKSSKPATRRPAGAKPAARTTLKAAKSPSPAAGKSRKSAATPASHKGASKRLKISSATEANPHAANSRNAKAKSPAKSGSAGSPAGNLPALVEGAAAPKFRLPRDGGSTVSLSDFAGKKLVLFFYPRADTPGCTREAIDFTRLSEAFAASGTALLGVSADSLKAQEKFRDKHEIAVPLISDEQHEMLEAYGAWGEKSLYGRTFQGIIRTTILVGTDGHVARIWRHVKVDGHADAVLAAARALGT